MIPYFTNICKLISEKIKNIIKTFCEVQIYQDVADRYRHYDERCPSCGAKSKLDPYGSYWRHMVYYANSKIEDKRIKILRFKCKSCKKTHALLPDVLIPYSPYSLNFKLSVLLEYFKREKTVVKICEYFGIAISTLYAWKKQLLDHKELMIGVIASKNSTIITFLRELFDSDSLQRFFSKYNFSFLQNKRKYNQSTTQSIPP